MITWSLSGAKNLPMKSFINLKTKEQVKALKMLFKFKAEIPHDELNGNPGDYLILLKDGGLWVEGGKAFEENHTEVVNG